MEKQYTVVYMCKLQPNVAIPDVVEKLSSLFQLSTDKTEKFLSSEKPLVIKRNLTLEIAQKYREKLVQIGLQVKLVETPQKTVTKKQITNTARTSGDETGFIKHASDPESSTQHEKQQPETLSPYAPPASELKDSLTKSKFVYASKWQRFANMLIDDFGYIVLAAIMGASVAFVGGENAVALMDSIPDVIFGYSILIVYYFSFEFFTGRTLGKLITRTRVVDDDGNKPSWRKILGRTFTRIVPFEAFTFLGKNGRGLHDRWPKTYVIKN